MESTDNAYNQAGSNPFSKLPSFTFTEAFPNSTIVAPFADIIVGGIEGGAAVALGIASGVSFFGGPEFWWITLPASGACIEVGVDSYGRIQTALERLGDCSPCN